MTLPLTLDSVSLHTLKVEPVDENPVYLGYHSVSYHVASKSLVVFGGTSLDKAEHPILPVRCSSLSSSQPPLATNP
jgi:hypothetical protein